MRKKKNDKTKKRILSKISTKKKGTGKRTKKFSRNVSRTKSKKSPKISRTKRKIRPRAKRKTKKVTTRKRLLSPKAQENKKARISKRTKKNFKYARNFKNTIKSFSRQINENKWENLEGKKFKFRGNAVIDAENAWDRVKWLSEMLYEKFKPTPGIKNEYDQEKNTRGYVYGMGFLLSYQRYTDSSFSMQATRKIKGKLKNHEDKLTVISFADLSILERKVFEKVIESLKTYNSITVILEGRIYRKSFSKKAKFPDTDYGKKT